MVGPGDVFLLSQPGSTWPPRFQSPFHDKGDMVGLGEGQLRSPRGPNRLPLMPFVG